MAGLTLEVALVSKGFGIGYLELLGEGDATLKLADLYIEDVVDVAFGLFVCLEAPESFSSDELVRMKRERDGTTLGEVLVIEVPSAVDAGGDGDCDYLLAVVGNLLRKLDGVDHSSTLCDEGGACSKENAEEQE